MNKNLFPKLLVLLAFILTRSIPATNSYFSDSKVISSNTISTGEWVSPAASSRITTNYDSYSDTYQPLTIETPLTLTYSLSDQTLVDNVQVQLCYSYNLAAFVCNSDNLFTGGSILFNFPNGAGLYLFETRIFDNSYHETKVLDPSASFVLAKYLSANYSQPLGLSLYIPDNHNSFLSLPAAPSVASNNLEYSPSATPTSAQFTYSLRYDQPRHEIVLQLDNIPSSFINTQDSLDYQITYFSSGREQGIAGSVIKSHVSNSAYDSPNYLGTCSQNVCTPDTIDNNAFTLILSGTLNGENINEISQIYQF